MAQQASQSAVRVVMCSKGKVRDRDAYYVRTLAKMMECCVPVTIQCCFLECVQGMSS